MDRGAGKDGDEDLRHGPAHDNTTDDPYDRLHFVHGEHAVILAQERELDDHQGRIVQGDGDI